MDRRDCMCLFILPLISHLITGQESWMVYLVNATIFDRYGGCGRFPGLSGDE